MVLAALPKRVHYKAMFKVYTAGLYMGSKVGTA